MPVLPGRSAEVSLPIGNCPYLLPVSELIRAEHRKRRFQITAQERGQLLERECQRNRKIQSYRVDRIFRILEGKDFFTLLMVGSGGESILW